MALNAKNLILASDFVSLKARVKAEMQRRSYYGSLASYAGTAYDYTEVPADDKIIKTEHINKLVTPMNAINTSGYSTKSAGDVIPELETLNIKLTAYEKTAIYGSVNDCASNCSGLCRTQCSNTCSGGCSGGCSGCGGACSTSCSSSCSGSCSGNCNGCGDGCTTSCRSDSCTAACYGNCAFVCSTDCTGGCGGGCGSSCSKDSCTSCTAYCMPTCKTGVGPQ